MAMPYVRREPSRTSSNKYNQIWKFTYLCAADTEKNKLYVQISKWFNN